MIVNTVDLWRSVLEANMEIASFSSFGKTCLGVYVEETW